MNNATTNPHPQTLALSPALRRRMRADVAELAREARALKQRLRQRWHEPMGAAQRRLSQVKIDVTYRLIALAAARGRFHLLALPRRGSIPGTDQYYFGAPGATLYILASWDPAAHRESVVRELVSSYESACTSAAEQVSP
ncbi:MAG TPA: hypothetical protein VI197_03465, partial [Polyangiaceae bacterium]